MPVTNAQIDSAVPSGGTPVRALTNSALKGLISDIAAVGVGVGVGTAATFADLPAASTVTGQRWWVLASTGVWLVNRNPKGAYYSDGTVWSYLGDFPVTAVEVGFTPTGGVAAVDLQAAVAELDTKKAPIASPTFTGTVGGVTKAMVGLGNADNTSDASKPVFTSSVAGIVPASGGGTVNFLRAYGTFASPPSGTVTSVAALTLGTSGTNLSSTVANGTTTPVITLNVPTASAVNRGALSAADWTTFNNKQNALGFTPTSVTGLTGTQSVAAFKTGLTLVRGDVGLGSVDNTSDASKPISTATQTALDAKADLASPTFTGTVAGITPAMLGLPKVAVGTTAPGSPATGDLWVDTN